MGAMILCNYASPFFFHANVAFTDLTLPNFVLSLGGYMVIVQFTIDKEGQYLGHTKLTKNCMFTVMTELWRQMMNEDLLTMVFCLPSQYPI